MLASFQSGCAATIFTIVSATLRARSRRFRYRYVVPSAADVKMSLMFSPLGLYTPLITDACVLGL